MGRWKLVVAGGLMMTVAMSAVVVAQESRRGDRVLHRYLDRDLWLELRGSGEAPPRAVRPPQRAPGEAPALEVSPGAEEWIWTSSGPVGPGTLEEPHGPLNPAGGETELDDLTDRVDSLDYQASFDPSVVPLKRGVAQNRVVRHEGGRYVSFLESRVNRPVAIGGDEQVGEELFWGSFLVRMEPGQRHSIPSVAPNQRVLVVNTEPLVDLEVEVDEADNFFVRGDHDGMVRINMRVAAPTTYFDGRFDDAVTWDDLPRGVAPLQRDVRRTAETVLSEVIGIDRDRHSPREALFRLVEYYRDFEGRPFPADVVGDRYVEITRQQVGVCRHRSLTFMVSALALGIPTRYVYNEAHAFVEVRWPGLGWRRIDLGGAADQFHYQNQQSSAIHEGGWHDDLPTPPAFQEELDRMEATGFDGLDQGSGDGPGEPAEARESSEVGDGGEGELGEPGEQGEPGEPGEFMGRAGLTTGDEQSMAPPEPPVELLSADGEVLRGHPLRVRGRVEAGAVQWVELFLVPVHAEGWAGALSLGIADVDSGGYFEGQWAVPSQVRLGRWRLRARAIVE